MQWFRSFLSNRRQRVVVGNAISSYQDLHGGVPQGAILSPLLFLAFINDITQITSAKLNLFADDTSAYITDKSPSVLPVRMQAAVSDLEAWFHQWALTVNTVKTALMVITTRRRSIPQLSISIYGQPIPQVLSHKHLGVHIQCNLLWSHQLPILCEKPHKE